MLGCLVGRWFAWVNGWVGGWSVSRPVGSEWVGWLAERLAGRAAGWFKWLTGWLADWLVG